MNKLSENRKQSAKNLLFAIEHYIHMLMNNIETAKKTLDEEDNEVYPKTVRDLRALHDRTKTYTDKAKLLVGDIAYIPNFNRNS